MKSIVKIYFLTLILCSCGNETKINSSDNFALGAFYANNHKYSKDSSNRFQQNCHFLFLLQSDSIEVYNRNSEYPLKEITTSKFRLNEFDCKRFISIVCKSLKLKKTPTNYDKIYDGLSFVVSKNMCQSSDYFIAEHGLVKNDEDFILEILEKSKLQKNIASSNRIIKEKYFMTALLHDENYRNESRVEFKD